MYNDHRRKLKDYQNITPRKRCQAQILGAKLFPTFKEQIIIMLCKLLQRRGNYRKLPVQFTTQHNPDPQT